MNQIEQKVKELYEKYPYPNDLILDKYQLLRHRWILNCIPHHIKPGKSIADIGCGTGEISLMLTQFGKVTGYDFSVNSILRAIEKAKQLKIINALFTIDDITEERKRLTYDYIFSIGTLHHIPKVHTAIENIKKMMHKDSYLIVSVYNKYSNVWDKRINNKSNLDNVNRYKDHYQHPYEHYYSRKEFKSLFIKHGFRIVGEWRKMPDFLRLLIGKGGMVTLCLKKNNVGEDR